MHAKMQAAQHRHHLTAPAHAHLSPVIVPTPCTRGYDVLCHISFDDGFHVTVQVARSPYKGVMDCIIKMLRYEGVGAFYRSFRTTVSISSKAPDHSPSPSPSTPVVLSCCMLLSMS